MKLKKSLDCSRHAWEIVQYFLHASKAELSKEMKILIYSIQHAMHPLPSFIPSQPFFLQYSHFSSPSNFTSSPFPMPT
jgi:hypothetical protein